jgi:hypothetical protein
MIIHSFLMTLAQQIELEEAKHELSRVHERLNDKSRQVETTNS